MEVDVTVAKRVTVGLSRSLSIPIGVATNVAMETDWVEGASKESPVCVSSSLEQSPGGSPNAARIDALDNLAL